LTLDNPVPTVYLARHATPDWSRTDIPYHLPPGPPLTAQGEREAVLLGSFLHDMGVCQLQASPLERCLRTAEIAAREAGVPSQVDTRLAEWLPGEKKDDVLKRIWPAWERAVAACADGRPIVLVTHGGPIGVLLKELGLPADELAQYQRSFDRSNPVPPAGVWRAIRPDPARGWALDLAFTPEPTREKTWFN
jgi:broad specificity phosphatase PhoE